MNKLKQSHLIKVNKNFNSIYNVIKWIFKRCAVLPTCFNDHTIIIHRLSCFLCPLFYPLPPGPLSPPQPLQPPLWFLRPETTPQPRLSPAALQLLSRWLPFGELPATQEQFPATVTTQRKLCSGSKPGCAQGAGKTKGFLRASGQDPAPKVGPCFPKVSAKHGLTGMCSFLSSKPAPLPPAHSARAPLASWGQVVILRGGV